MRTDAYPRLMATLDEVRGQWRLHKLLEGSLLTVAGAEMLPKAGAIDFLAFGLTACRPALQTIITYALQQRLIPRKIEVDDLFDDTTRALDG